MAVPPTIGLTPGNGVVAQGRRALDLERKAPLLERGQGGSIGLVLER